MCIRCATGERKVNVYTLRDRPPTLPFPPMPPDFDRLTAVNDEFERLAGAGELTKAEFERLLADAEDAVGEHTEFLEGLLMRGAELGLVKR